MTETLLKLGSHSLKPSLRMFVVHGAYFAIYPTAVDPASMIGPSTLAALCRGSMSKTTLTEIYRRVSRMLLVPCTIPFEAKVGNSKNLIGKNLTSHLPHHKRSGSSRCCFWSCSKRGHIQLIQTWPHNRLFVRSCLSSQARHIRSFTISCDTCNHETTVTARPALTDAKYCVKGGEKW